MGRLGLKCPCYSLLWASDGRIVFEDTSTVFHSNVPCAIPVYVPRSWFNIMGPFSKGQFREISNEAITAYSSACFANSPFGRLNVAVWGLLGAPKQRIALKIVIFTALIVYSSATCNLDGITTYAYKHPTNC